LADRVENREHVYKVLDAEVRRHSTETLLAQLDAAGVPCARVNDIGQVFENAQVRHRNMLLSIPHPIYGSLPTLGPAVKYSGFDIADGWKAPPLLGEHTAQVFADWLGEVEASADRERAVEF